EADGHSGKRDVIARPPVALHLHPGAVGDEARIGIEIRDEFVHLFRRMRNVAFEVEIRHVRAWLPVLPGASRSPRRRGVRNASAGWRRPAGTPLWRRWWRRT